MMNPESYTPSQPESVYIGLGSNLGDPKQQLHQAIAAISQLQTTQLAQTAAFYSSQPMGPQDQNDYINSVIAIETLLAPLELLNALQSVELSQGRERKGERWGPRTIDLDILFYGEHHFTHPRLTVPHYGIQDRNFVLLPLAELNPNLRLSNGKSIGELSEQIHKTGIKKL